MVWGGGGVLPGLVRLDLGIGGGLVGDVRRYLVCYQDVKWKSYCIWEVLEFNKEA